MPATIINAGYDYQCRLRLSMPATIINAGTEAGATFEIMCEEFYVYSRRLPHWRQGGVMYFVTWRLHALQTPLCEGERELVCNVLRHFHEQRYELAAFVVMDDHVHALLHVLPPYKLQDILHTWKSYSAHQLQRTFARENAVWQKETWDRIMRDGKEIEEKRLYILQNPFKRWPELQAYRWLEPQP